MTDSDCPQDAADGAVACFLEHGFVVVPGEPSAELIVRLLDALEADDAQHDDAQRLGVN
jgi:hypothetical protein